MTLEKLQHHGRANPGRPRSKCPLWNAPTQPLPVQVVRGPLAGVPGLFRAYWHAQARRLANQARRHGH